MFRRASVLVRSAPAVAVVVGMVITGAVASAAALGWSVVPSPSPAASPLADFSAVSCSSATNCFAVGEGMLMEHWDGKSWSIVSTPTASGVTRAELNGISCSGTKSCVAVGDSARRTATGVTVATLVEHWNGRRWAIVPSPTPSAATDVLLSAVSCSSATSCFAVGDVSTRPILEFKLETFVERWNGTRWSLVSSPSPRDSQAAALLAVSCPTATSCFAAGHSFGAAGALMEHWNGKRWSVVSLPVPDPGRGSSQDARGIAKARFVGGFRTRADARTGLGPRILSDFGTDTTLYSVSCSSAKSCFAVGGSYPRPLVERWNGTRWSMLAIPTPRGADGSELQSVSCSSPTECWSVGDFGVSSASDPAGFHTETLAEHWDGTAWSIVDSPTPSGAFVVFLQSVSCPSAASCVAVGSPTLMEHWTGTSWRIVPLNAQSSQSELIDVACSTPTVCFAVGAYSRSSAESALVERWNGARWSISPTPTPPGARWTFLAGVSCARPTECFAVGSYATSSLESPLVERWNGVSWSIVPTPIPAGADEARLNGVACITPTNCTAVGSYATSTAGATLVEHWNGTAWSVATSPSPLFGFDSDLIGVSCPTSSKCTAVGVYLAYTGDRTRTTRALIEQWNGTRWSMVAAPALRAPEAGLFGVDCRSATNCSAVGFQSSSDPTALTLAEHWNGTVWSAVPSPTPRGATDAQLNDVSCASAHSCEAVGYFSTSAATGTMVEHWNGSSWSIEASPNPNATTDAGLIGVSCSSPTTCSAVGSYDARGGYFTLTERTP